ncbi:hypothetical protein [Cohnella sp. GbtcB17]|uniref:hypothetical protein n=1 Tax=Cohnella sp. GbtcB17 TaxID=2824762 RepID=UPI001C30D5CF|nr:hypothetical protein [Cohnella sp. GbtcB17]
MSMEAWIIAAAWIVTSGIMLVAVFWLEKRNTVEQDKMFEERCAWKDERQAWAVERQQLLDRIQAPSFGEYKQAEIKVIKAQNGDREASRLEPL